MVALDTNVIVRLLTADDPLQARRAAALIAREPRVWIPVTVLLETEWVLRAAYELRKEVIEAALRKLLALPQVEPDHPEAVEAALKGYAGGLDFADALHLALSSPAERFATFDRRLRARATRLQKAGPKVVVP